VEIICPVTFMMVLLVLRKTMEKETLDNIDLA